MALRLPRWFQRSQYRDPLPSPTVPGDDGPRTLDPYRDAPTVAEGYRSRFGGLWTDLPNAVDLAKSKFADGALTELDLENVLFWIEKGYVILPGAVSLEEVGRLREELETIWTEGHDEAWVSSLDDGVGEVRRLRLRDRERLGEQVKLLDIYSYSENARRVMFASPIQRFLEVVFERPPLAHQSLCFYRGSRQPMHQDTVFVRMSSPMELTASWIALEDIQPGSGELEYFEGSHRFEEFLFEGQSKWVPPTGVGLPEFYGHLEAQARDRGLEPVRFLPKTGDALIWSADLVHGGSPYDDPEKTRRSLVTHYCPVDVYPMYRHFYPHTDSIQWKGKSSYYCHTKKQKWRAGS